LGSYIAKELQKKAVVTRMITHNTKSLMVAPEYGKYALKEYFSIQNAR
jgi:hypothetical protein